MCKACQAAIDKQLQLVQETYMTLDRFMQIKGLTGMEVAKTLARSPSMVTRYRNRTHTPPGAVIAKLLEISNGRITVPELLRHVVS